MQDYNICLETSTPHRVASNLAVNFLADHGVDTLSPVLVNSDD